MAPRTTCAPFRNRLMEDQFVVGVEFIQLSMGVTCVKWYVCMSHCQARLLLCCLGCHFRKNIEPHTQSHKTDTRYPSHTPPKTLYSHASWSNIYSRTSVHGVRLHSTFIITHSQTHFAHKLHVGWGITLSISHIMNHQTLSQDSYNYQTSR